MKFLKNHDYKVTIRDVYSRKKKHKVYETWFIHFDIDFEEMQYGDWIKDFYRNNKFSL